MWSTWAWFLVGSYKGIGMLCFVAGKSWCDYVEGQVVGYPILHSQPTHTHNVQNHPSKLVNIFVPSFSSFFHHARLQLHSSSFYLHLFLSWLHYLYLLLEFILNMLLFSDIWMVTRITHYQHNLNSCVWIR